MIWEERLPKGQSSKWSYQLSLLSGTSFYVSVSLSTEGCWTYLLPWAPIDLVVSNPPYIFHKDMEQLAPEICRYRVGGRLEKLYWDPPVLEDFSLEKTGGAQRGQQC